LGLEKIGEGVPRVRLGLAHLWPLYTCHHAIGEFWSLRDSSWLDHGGDLLDNS